MDRPGDEANGVDRARWLAELAEAIDQAQRIAWTLGIAEGDNPQARDLYGQLECVRVEIDSLRQGRWAWRSTQIDPLWRSSPIRGKPILSSPA